MKSKFNFANILHVLAIGLSAVAVGFQIFGNKGVLPGELQGVGNLVNSVGTAFNPAAPVTPGTTPGATNVQ